MNRAWMPDTLQALQRVTDVALAHLPLDDLLTELLERIVAILHSDTAAFLLLDEDGDELVARAAKGIEEKVERGVRIPLGRGFAGRIAAEKRAIAIPDVEDADLHSPILRERGIRSLLGVPLLVEGDVLGVLHVGTLTPREYTESDADLLQLAADRAALGIAHARERQSLRVLQALQRVTDVGLSYLPLNELLAELLEGITEILDSDTAAFLLLDEDGDELVATAAKGIEEEVAQGVRIPLGRGFAGRVAGDRRAIFIPDTAQADIFNPILRERGIRSLLGVPLMSEGAVIGVLHVGALIPRTFTEADTKLLQLAADRAAVTIERARLYHQRGVVEALHQSLVPERLPVVPGLELAARYRPAVRRGGIGGDWYDAFPLAGGGFALVAGDVMGHGISAAAMMAQMRTGLRAYALDGHGPAEIVERLNRLALTLASHQMTTLVFAVLDLDRELAQVISAGHLPPVLRAADGSARLLELASDAPLGVSTATAYHVHEFALPVGSTLVLVTDGAVEVRGESVEHGLERLRELVAGHDDLDDVCDAVARGDVRGRPADDDLAVLAARVQPLDDRLSTRWPADAESLAAMRPLLRRWLSRRGADDDEIYDITVAVQEASANAVEHAYGPGAATFEVQGSDESGVITFVIRDRGQWRAPRGTHRGRGLAMMRALMESVDVERDERGTVVTLRRTLGRKAA